MHISRNTIRIIIIVAAVVVIMSLVSHFVRLAVWKSIIAAGVVVALASLLFDFFWPKQASDDAIDGK